LKASNGSLAAGTATSARILTFEASLPPAPLASKNTAFAKLRARLEADAQTSEKLASARAWVAEKAYADEGETIKSLRLKKGWSQQVFAEKLMTTQAQVARIEKGNIDPQRSTCKRLREVLDISADYLEELMDRQEQIFKSRTEK
jgi:ribosome-binding protein aMBF1 (putative translation factor)